MWPVVKLHQIQGVSAKTFEPNNSVILQRIFVKFKMQICWTVKNKIPLMQSPKS
jgi:hypothetical protein